MKNMLSNEKALVNVFQNVPVAVLGWYIQDYGERNEEQCAQASVVYNDAFCRLTGYSPREVELRFDGSISNIVVEADRHEFQVAIHELCQYPHEKQISFRFRKKNGDLVEVTQKLSSIRQADGSIWVYAVAVEYGNQATEMSDRRIAIRTFGFFNVLIDGQPVAFQHEKAKELLALLTDRQGKFVSAGEIISCLWEDEPVNNNTRGRCRKAVYQLRETLARYGLENCIESTSKGYRRIRTEMIDCDLYRYLAGESASMRAFRGAYMLDYSWAEQTLTALMYAK